MKGELRVPYDVSATRATIERLQAELAQKESVLDKGRALIAANRMGGNAFVLAYKDFEAALNDKE